MSSTTMTPTTNEAVRNLREIVASLSLPLPDGVKPEVALTIRASRVRVKAAHAIHALTGEDPWTLLASTDADRLAEQMDNHAWASAQTASYGDSKDELEHVRGWKLGAEGLAAELHEVTSEAARAGYRAGQRFRASLERAEPGDDYEPCPRCDGEGCVDYDDSPRLHTCPECGGAKRVPAARLDPLPHDEDWREEQKAAARGMPL